ncbi:MAG: glycoside hydrolase family 18 [Prevotellaceae bacterium]|nr:glycoside hydrolase family 18 [Prevotellaceae bacterium]
MKKIYSLLLLLGVTFFVASCDTDMEIKDPANLTTSVKTEQYYAALRAYKQTDHPVTFGWFGNWVGSGVSLENSLSGLPDSVDFVSIWGNWRDLSPEKKADLEYVQKVKGTRALLCFIVANIGDQLTPSGQTPQEYWGFSNDDEASIEAAIVKYANQICDTIDKYGYDGFDWDYEPNYGSSGNIAGQPAREKVFVEALSKRIGPKSGTGRLFVIDGEPQSVNSELGPLFDYFIVQAYSCTGDANLDSRLNSTIRNFDGVLEPEVVAKKYIVTENFENYAAAGGVTFTDRYGNRMMSLEGMARWTPIINGKKVQKGGIGTYHMEYEYNAGKQPSYPALRAGTQIMNPSIK